MSIHAVIQNETEIHFIQAKKVIAKVYAASLASARLMLNQNEILWTEWKSHA